MNAARHRAAGSAKEIDLTHMLRQTVIGALVMALLVACNTSSPTQVPSTTAIAASAGSTTGPTPSPAGAPASQPASLQTVPPVAANHADPALEAQLPAVVSGTPLQRSSATFAELLASGGDRTAIDAFLQRIGKSEADGTYAAAFDPTNALGGGIFAFKVSGADAATLLAGVEAIEQADLGANATTRQATVGGKNVTVVSVGSGVNDTEWIYGRGDVVFVVHAADETHAAAYLGALQ